MRTSNRNENPKYLAFATGCVPAVMRYAIDSGNQHMVDLIWEATASPYFEPCPQSSYRGQRRKLEFIMQWLLPLWMKQLLWYLGLFREILYLDLSREWVTWLCMKGVGPFLFTVSGTYGVRGAMADTLKAVKTARNAGIHIPIPQGLLSGKPTAEGVCGHDVFYDPFPAELLADYHPRTAEIPNSNKKLERIPVVRGRVFQWVNL